MCQGDPAISSEVDGEPGDEAINTQSGVKVPREISHRSRAWQKGRLSRRKVVGGEQAGQEKPQAASSFAHDCFFFSGRKQGRGWGDGSMGAGQRGVPTRAWGPRLGERTFPAGQGQPLESLNSQLGRGLPVATGAGSEQLQGLLKSQHTLNTATHMTHSATAKAHNQTHTPHSTARNIQA